MADINLVPQQVKVEQKKQSVVRQTTVLSVFLALAVVGVSGYLFMKVTDLESKVENTENQIAESRAKIVELSEIEVIARNLDLKYKSLKEIFDTRSNYSLLLDEFSKRIPPSITFDTFGFGRENSINVSGRGDNYLAIAQFVNNLADSDFEGGNEELKGLFTGVTLNSVSLDSQNDVEASYFIVIDYNPELLKK